MIKITDAKTFKLWLDQGTNRENLRKLATPVTHLPEYDDWLNDDIWDQVYEETVTNKK